MCEILREHAVNARHKKYDKNIKQEESNIKQDEKQISTINL